MRVPFVPTKDFGRHQTRQAPNLNVFKLFSMRIQSSSQACGLQMGGGTSEGLPVTSGGLWEPLGAWGRPNISFSSTGKVKRPSRALPGSPETDFSSTGRGESPSSWTETTFSLTGREKSPSRDAPLSLFPVSSTGRGKIPSQARQLGSKFAFSACLSRKSVLLACPALSCGPCKGGAFRIRTAFETMVKNVP